MPRRNVRRRRRRRTTSTEFWDQHYSGGKEIMSNPFKRDVSQLWSHMVHLHRGHAEDIECDSC